MNKRMTEKRYKRKFQRVLANTMSFFLDRHIKPSRVRLSVYEMDGEAVWMIGRAQGLEMELRIFNEPQWEETR